MYLKQFIFINWGNIPNGEFAFGPMNLFSGASGSGKTTAADAIQTVMTAAKNNLFHFNPGQEETTQRGKGGKQVRTLASYVLGCDDGSFARENMTDGYLIAQFAPNVGEPADGFCAVIGVRADYDRAGNRHIAREIDSRFFILPFREQVQLDDFLSPDRKQIVGLDKIANHLRNLYGGDQKSTAVEEYTSKKSYLCRLYGALRGQHTAVSEREAHNAARAFSRFMAYKPVASINDFVATEILDKKDLGEAIQQISGMMKTINGMEQDARRISDAIERLTTANQHGLDYIQHWLEYNQKVYVLALVNAKNAQQKFRAEKNKQSSLKHALADNAVLIKQLQQQFDNLQERNIDILARRKGYKELEEKDRLQQAIESQQQALVNGVKQLLIDESQVQTNVAVAKLLLKHLADQTSTWLSKAELKSIQGSGKKVASNSQWEQLDYQQLLTQDWVDIKPFQAFLLPAQATQQQQMAFWAALMAKDSGADSVYLKLRRYYDAKIEQQTKITNKIKQLSLEIERLERSKTIKLPNHVSEALFALEKQLPEAAACVLCDFVQIEDPHWQSAIEGYIGGNRFALIVDPAFEAKAISIVRNLRGKNTAKVIQGEKAKRDADRVTLEEDSMVKVMCFSHATAQAFIEASYGNVLRVDDIEQLRFTRRGLCAEGIGTGNYSLWRCDIDDAELVFGNSARNRALAAKNEQLDRIAIEENQLKEELVELKELIAALDSLDKVFIADQVNSILESYNQAQTLQKQLADLSIDQYDELEQTRSDIEVQQKQTRLDIDAALKEQGMLEEQLEQCETAVQSIADAKDKLQQEADKLASGLEQTARIWSKSEPEQLLLAAEAKVDNCDLKVLEQKQLPSLQKQLERSRLSLVSAIKEHNQQSHEVEKIVLALDVADLPNIKQFESICSIQLNLDNVLTLLRSNVLVEKREQINRLKQSFDTTFVDHLCGAIHYSVKEGERILMELNEELQLHEFGQEKETYRFDWDFIPEYKEYWDFFEEVRKYPVGEGATLFDSEFSKRSARVRDRIISMLLENEDEVIAFRELERIADYRNYRNYEIYKEVPGKAPIALSEYGTGSGGQLETPAYIIRAAAITSAFQFKQSGAHLRFVLVDEAFSKMDEARSRSVLRYLTESLGLQVIFIMPSKASGPFLDMISNQFVFAKYPLAEGERRGQLKTGVYVDRKECDQEKIQALWHSYRQTIHEQAHLDFMEEVLANESEL